MEKIYYLILLFLSACHADEEVIQELPIENPSIIGADLSFLAQVESTQTQFYNADGEVEEVLVIMKNAGINTVRLRLWHSPDQVHSSLEEVKAMAKRIKSIGLKIWLAVHYSDTWADPGQQQTPKFWQDADYEMLKDSVFQYTQTIMQEINPDYIQIGNEINSGFLKPIGDLTLQKDQFLGLIQEASQAIRLNSMETKIIIHYAGFEGADFFYQNLIDLDYDIIGLSYYPWWHGKDLNALASSLASLRGKYNKDILIAETAYPFTLAWQDQTHNVVGLDQQLILPEYPATPDGQKKFLNQLKSKLSDSGGLGFCYWGGEWVAFDGEQSSNGSSWENLALFDFEYKVLPVIDVFE